MGVLNLIEPPQSEINSAERIIFASSMSVYGEVQDKPITESDVCGALSCYGVGKLAAEGYLKVYQILISYSDDTTEPNRLSPFHSVRLISKLLKSKLSSFG